MNKSKKSRKPKKMITMDIKREIIEKHENGARVSDLARFYDRSTSTICTILKQKEAIKKVSASKGITIIHPSRSNVHNEMEKLLLTWIKETQLTGGTITEGIICEKALKIYENLNGTSTEPPSTSTPKFRASHGWFEKFKKRTGILSRKKASSDAAVAKEFCRLISEERYIGEQVFNCDKTDLTWKIPRSVSVSTDEEAEGNKPITLALCANARGDLKLKPLLVCQTDNSPAFKKLTVDKTKLHVTWRVNANASITPQIFVDWINEVFGPSVKKYLTEKKIPLKCLLILNNDSGHPPDLENKIDIKFKFIKIFYFPSLFQAMNQIIPNYKKMFKKHLLKCSKNNFDILSCLKVITKAWENMSETTLNSAWETLWPEPAENVIKSDLTNNIVSLRGCIEIEHSVELMAEELCEVQIIQDTKNLKGRVNERENFFMGIKEMLKKWEEVSEFIKNTHPDKLNCARAEYFYNKTCVEHFRKILKGS